ncbi:MAG: hypoxanthine-guanine phosphoribosyltransferase [Gammaproteobacteria bacterium RIFCSPHIGHO2_02_FULL_42_13]|nr:MAG: hypoxanthine-guanine phosphoribosyltransferase [Gammaproteobacteria bacterium RIFCSPHIGHO2_02_FULL_42_13]OGT68167.1 MAG: hypoxanthine-guanine phosphoribosyltransferase [Gammaproteobacteria bacterium RIFCSPLOWO2_02_FULL_42_9]
MIDFADVDALFKKAHLLHGQAEINAVMDKMAVEIKTKLGDTKPIMLCILNGALIFMGHLLTRLNFPLQIDYVHVSRYRGEIQGRNLDWIAEPNGMLEGRTVVLVEDILDSGLTLSAVKDYCTKRRVKNVYTAVLIDKNHPRDPGGLAKADFTGLYVEDKFLIGYGLDYKGFCRNLPGIYAVET